MDFLRQDTFIGGVRRMIARPNDYVIIGFYPSCSMNSHRPGCFRGDGKQEPVGFISGAGGGAR